MHASVLARLLHVLQCLAVPAHATVQFTPDGAVVRRGRPAGAWVAVLGPRTALTLRFSPDVPERCRQRLRNVLGVHRHALLPPNVR
jgi:hypothetical protein